MTTRTVFTGILALWILGWIWTGFLDWRRGRLYHRARDEGESFKDTAIRLLFQFFMWPILVGAARQQVRYYSDIRSGRREKWLLYEPGEDSVAQWTLKDGTPFHASADGGFRGSGTLISADFGNDAIIHPIEYRITMLAPTPAPSSEWTSLRFTPRPPEPNPRDERAVDHFVSKRYSASIKLPRGKYRADFRVHSPAQPEEFSGLIAIVHGKNDVV